MHRWLLHLSAVCLLVAVLLPAAASASTRAEGVWSDPGPQPGAPAVLDALSGSATAAVQDARQAAPVTTWRILFLVFRETDTDYEDLAGVTRHLKATLPQADIDGLLSSLSGAVQPAVREWSSGQAAWDVEVQYPAEPITRVAQLDARNNWVAPDCISGAISRYFRPDYHDFVMVYWRRSDDAGNSIPSDGWGWGSFRRSPDYGYVTVTYADWNTWSPDVADTGSQIWIHEWLHPVCWFYRDLGYRLPSGDSDGGGSHGYTNGQPPYPGWGTFYADLMNNRVLEDGVNTGIPPEAWARGTFRGGTAASFTITPSVVGGATGHGSISPPGVQTVVLGDTPTFTFTPDPGYRVNAVRVDGDLVAPSTPTSYTFPAVSGSHTIAVEFAANEFTITPSVAGGHGNVLPGTAQVVSVNATPTFTFWPDPGFHVAEVRVDGALVTLTGEDAYTFPAVSASHSISVSFAADTPAPAKHTITPSVLGGHGSISPATAQTVSAGASMTFTFLPDAGYKVGEVRVDGVAVATTGADRYTFVSVGASHTISVSYVSRSPEPGPTPETITVTAPRPVTVKYGRTALLPFRVDGTSHGGTADVTITIKSLAGKIVSKKAMRKVPLNTTRGYAFTCTLNRGRYRFSVTAVTPSGIRSANTASNTLRVR